ncbi:hypothetical protein PoB_007167200 [Plakobranchus ocellatus]|uniref:Uncharacterized protein n=1 Tax=Plakobranchus ocellatus TaxID=259542 RepID=A0AAV4DLK7_9GAST|nr:hypothetical protein PoB_007167200 [Plakobranchus ocellatus]
MSWVGGREKGKVARIQIDQDREDGLGWRPREVEGCKNQMDQDREDGLGWGPREVEGCKNPDGPRQARWAGLGAEGRGRLQGSIWTRAGRMSWVVDREKEKAAGVQIDQDREDGLGWGPREGEGCRGPDGPGQRGWAGLGARGRGRFQRSRWTRTGRMGLVGGREKGKIAGVHMDQDREDGLCCGPREGEGCRGPDRLGQGVCVGLGARGEEGCRGPEGPGQGWWAVLGLKERRLDQGIVKRQGRSKVGDREEFPEGRGYRN